MWGEHPRFAHLWRTSFRTSRPLFARTQRGEGGEGEGRRGEGCPKRSVSEADSTNSGSSHARGPGIKQLIGTAVSISSLTSRKHEGKSNFLSSAHLGFLPSFLLFFRTFGNPPPYCKGVSLRFFLRLLDYSISAVFFLILGRLLSWLSH